MYVLVSILAVRRRRKLTVYRSICSYFSGDGTDQQQALSATTARLSQSYLPVDDPVLVSLTLHM